MIRTLIHKLRFLLVWVFCPDLAIDHLAELEIEREALRKHHLHLQRENAKLEARIEQIYRQANEGTQN